MIIERTSGKKFFDIYEKLSNKTFNINTQYKFILLKNEIEKDGDIIDEQMKLILNEYGEKDSNNEIIRLEDGGYKIKEDVMEECLEKVQQVQNQKIQVPDIYFSLDELENLELTLPELQVLAPFIKI